MGYAASGNYDYIKTIQGDDELSSTFSDLCSLIDNVKGQESQMYEVQIKKQDLRNRQQQMELMLLVSQINPHFIYNALETIRMMALSQGAEDVSEATVLLGNTMRYVLENTETMSVPLSKELDYIENYLSYLSYYQNGDNMLKNTERGKARKLASVRSFFKYLFNHDMISSNVASKIQTPKLHSKEIIRLEKDEVSRMLNAVQSPTSFSEHQRNYNKNTQIRDNAIVTLFLGTGIRISELVGLNVEDFDFSQDAFKVTRKGGNQAIL